MMPPDRLDLLELTGAAGDAPALVTATGTVSYRELRGLVATCRAALAGHRKHLVIVDAPRTVPGIVGYLATLSAGHTAVVVEEGGPDLWRELTSTYRPELLLTASDGERAAAARAAGFRPVVADPVAVWRHLAAGPPLHPELGLVARTSGSLAQSKLVRLSYRNLRANARAIVAALGLRDSDRLLTSLPLDYSYGLSQVNSAFAAGAALAVTTYPPSGQPFWDFVRYAGGTVVGAVPSSYAVLRARSWQPAGQPALRLLLSSGGPLDEPVRSYHVARMAQAGGGFVAMYGQTEATARIACLPPALADRYPGSVGSAIPGVETTVELADGSPAADGETGEIVVRGPGVMMGYATARQDLAEPDRQRGVLRTGDLGYLREGMLYLTGRADRQVKVFGRRIDLDEVERHLGGQGLTAAAEAVGDEVRVLAELRAPTGSGSTLAPACRWLGHRLGLPPSAVRARAVAALPYNARGKLDRPAVRRALQEVH